MIHSITIGIRWRSNWIRLGRTICSHGNSVVDLRFEGILPRSWRVSSSAKNGLLAISTLCLCHNMRALVISSCEGKLTYKVKPVKRVQHINEKTWLPYLIFRWRYWTCLSYLCCTSIGSNLTHISIQTYPTSLERRKPLRCNATDHFHFPRPVRRQKPEQLFKFQF